MMPLVRVWPTSERIHSYIFTMWLSVRAYCSLFHPYFHHEPRTNKKDRRHHQAFALWFQTQNDVSVFILPFADRTSSAVSFSVNKHKGYNDAIIFQRSLGRIIWPLHTLYVYAFFNPEFNLTSIKYLYELGWFFNHLFNPKKFNQKIFKRFSSLVFCIDIPPPDILINTFPIISLRLPFALLFTEGSYLLWANCLPLQAPSLTH